MEKKYSIHLQNVDALSSGLLGYFDADGSYIIEDGIIQELVLCNKIISSFKEDKITATANVGSFKIDFNIYLQEGEDNKKRAGLFVLEKGKMGFIDKELQTYVDSVILENDGNFLPEVKKRFHLYMQDESEGIDINNSGLKLILAKKDSAIKKYKILIPVLQSADKTYVAKMLGILKESGPHGRQVLEEFKGKLGDIKASKIDPSYWREAKLMLDKLLMKNHEVFELLTLEQMAKVQNEYMTAYANAKEPVPEKAPAKSAPKKKEEKKKDDKKKKKKPADKGKGKDKGGKSAGKDKPKDKPSEQTKSVSGKEPIAHIDHIETIEIDTENQTVKRTEVFGFRVENTIIKEREAQANKNKPSNQRDNGMER